MADYDLNALRQKLEEIKRMEWVENRRKGNDGGVGNTLEDLLGVAENNLQLPDFGKWEIKSQRSKSSLLTLFHCEPEPRNENVVPSLLRRYGWRHEKAGTTYPENERSFRQTIKVSNYSSRGFKVTVDQKARKILITFDFEAINGEKHSEWRDFIKNGVGTGKISPAPYWTFEQIENKLETKLRNLAYIFADRKKIKGVEYFKYNKIEIHFNPTLDNFLALMEEGTLYIDFDARTGHNHGTKFRIPSNRKADLYQDHILV